VDNAIGPMMESGLDNSPMWDGVPFDQAKHLQCLHDAGLNGLYVRDCESLEVLAGILGRSAEAGELHARGDRYRDAIEERLWDEKTGLFLNRRTDTGERSPRVSPDQLLSAARRRGNRRAGGAHDKGALAAPGAVRWGVSSAVNLAMTRRTRTRTTGAGASGRR
jgi:hypothetical protein